MLNWLLGSKPGARRRLQSRRRRRTTIAHCTATDARPDVEQEILRTPTGRGFGIARRQWHRLCLPPRGVYRAGSCHSARATCGHRASSSCIATAALPHAARCRAAKRKCGECSFRIICGGSRRAYAATGDPMAGDPLCLYQPRHPLAGESCRYCCRRGWQAMNGWQNKIASILALIIGVMAVFAGGVVAARPGYSVVGWLPIYNFAAGVFTTLVTAILIWRRHWLAALLRRRRLGYAVVMLILVAAYRGAVAPQAWWQWRSASQYGWPSSRCCGASRPARTIRSHRRDLSRFERTGIAEPLVDYFRQFIFRRRLCAYGYHRRLACDVARCIRYTSFGSRAVSNHFRLCYNRTGNCAPVRFLSAATIVGQAMVLGYEALVLQPDEATALL